MNWIPCQFSFAQTTSPTASIDESLLGGSFVEKVQQHWWPEYSWRKFFWFNAGYFAIMIASVVLYDLRGGGWVVKRACTDLCGGDQRWSSLPRQ